MPKYVISSESPISARELNRPDLPEWEVGGGPVIPEGSWQDYVKEKLEALPPREEWPTLPPDWRDRLPIPPDWGHPSVPLPPDVEELPPVWPPLPELPDFPDLSGKTLALARIYISRKVSVLRWIVVDHEEAKKHWQAIKGKLPAGGIVGRPPPTQGRP